MTSKKIDDELTQPKDDKPKDEQPKQVGGSHMKTIRVTNVQAEAKKNALIL